MTVENKSLINLALKKALKPLARILIKYEISHSEFMEVSKQAYAEAAYKHFKIPNRKMTFSRVAVLTGLSRKEVVRLISEKERKVPIPKVTKNRATRVFMGWITDPEFCDEDGHPKPLAFNGENSFHSLVEKYSGDIPARAILDDLILKKVVERDKDDNVHLLNANYLEPKDDIHKFEILSLSMANLLRTGAHNIDQESSSNLRLQREYNRLNVPESIASEFKTVSEKKSQKLLVDLFNWVVKKVNNEQENDQNEPTKHIGLGVYYIEDDSTGNEQGVMEENEENDAKNNEARE